MDNPARCRTPRRTQTAQRRAPRHLAAGPAATPGSTNSLVFWLPNTHVEAQLRALYVAMQQVQQVASETAQHLAIARANASLESRPPHMHAGLPHMAQFDQLDLIMIPLVRHTFPNLPRCHHTHAHTTSHSKVLPRYRFTRYASRPHRTARPCPPRGQHLRRATPPLADRAILHSSRPTRACACAQINAAARRYAAAPPTCRRCHGS